MTWRKTRFPHPDAALAEADGLRWLAQVPDGARVARVHDVGPGVLELESIRSGTTTAAAARAFGAALARTHAARADFFGQVPGSTGGFMAQAPMPGPSAPNHAPLTALTWGEFYATARVLPFLRTAVGQGSITPDGAATVEAVAARLVAGDLEHDQPAGVRERTAQGRPAVARLHGDLWNGNVLWDADAGGEAVLIDATAHGGHAETDLAMLDLFGQPHLREILEGYQEVSPLADGWPDRIALHQLNPLLVHTVLFGSSYADAAVGAAAAYV
ncbi:fructosamine kinase family protein [Occultella gossypii]|uniref:Fructosamine kinase family protein n=1 Tax=Occultella gossypii TaxID=2800820 RepID=A0ABS7SED6_9MICO|nr:fructosamine kinase family protein [Occultella gossypii]MBZ2198711.1 fructosamine kinase family protein [Occultella gossypii]